MINSCVYQTPVGQLTVLSNDGVVVASGFCEPEKLYIRLPPDHQHELVASTHLEAIDAPIERYLSGEVAALAELQVSQAGTDLQQQVWEGLRQIPAGQTRNYSELARTTDKPKAVRAVGTACGANLIAPMVPCHRALRSDGSLGGYYYGLEVKRWLLEHESASQLEAALSRPGVGQP